MLLADTVHIREHPDYVINRDVLLMIRKPSAEEMQEYMMHEMHTVFKKLAAGLDVNNDCVMESIGSSHWAGGAARRSRKRTHMVSEPASMTITCSSCAC